MLPQLFDDLNVACSLIVGHKRMQVESRPGQRSHLTCSIKLHRATSQRNHRSVKTDVLLLQVAKVSHHLTLGVNRVEDFLGHEGVFSCQVFRKRWDFSFQRSYIDFWLLGEVSKNTPNVCQVFPLG